MRTRGRGDEGEKTARWGDRGGDDLCPGIWGAYVHQMFQKIQNNTLSSLFKGGGRRAGCVYSSKSIQRSSSIFGKLLGMIEFEFLRNLKYLVVFEVRAWIRKERLVDAEASPSIHASIHRSLVPPTALHYTVCKEGLRQINTCRKVPLQVNFLDDNILLFALVSI